MDLRAFQEGFLHRALVIHSAVAYTGNEQESRVHELTIHTIPVEAKVLFFFDHEIPLKSETACHTDVCILL